MQAVKMVVGGLLLLLVLTGASCTLADPAADTTSPANDSTTSTTPSSTTENPAPEIPDGVTTPTTAPSDYPLVFKFPEKCGVSDCTVYVGIQSNKGNSSYLDFYIEGDAKAWVAVGFTPTPSMLDTDVMACNRINGGEEVEVLNSWNPPGGHASVVNRVMNAYAFSKSLKDGRVFCSFGRAIAGSDNEEEAHDKYLNDSYYVLYGHSNGDTSSGFLRSHRSAKPPSSPYVSSKKYNVVKDSGVAEHSQIESDLIRAHGAAMLIAWLLLVNIGTFFASYMRPALPNGGWFQVHRVVMVIALLLSAAGFVLIFVSQYQNTIPGLINIHKKDRVAHLAIGITAMLLQIVNPIVAIFRCHPGAKNRWIFRVFHGYILGQLTPILGIANVGLGLAMFSKDYSRFGDLTLLWVFLGYVGAKLIMRIAFIAISRTIGRDYCRSCNSPRSSCTCSKMAYSEAEKTSYGTTLINTNVEKDCKKPAEGSLYLWIAMGISIAIFVVFSLGLLVLVAIP